MPVYIEKKVGCYHSRTDEQTNKQGKIELLSHWPMEGWDEQNWLTGGREEGRRKRKIPRIGWYPMGPTIIYKRQQFWRVLQFNKAWDTNEPLNIPRFKILKNTSRSSSSSPLNIKLLIRTLWWHPLNFVELAIYQVHKIRKRLYTHYSLQPYCRTIVNWNPKAGLK